MADHLDKLIDELHTPLTVRRINTRTGELQVIKLTEPDPAAKRDLAISIGILSDKIANVLTVNAPQEGRAAVIALYESLKLAVTDDDATITQDSDGAALYLCFVRPEPPDDERSSNQGVR
jgi:hypothetical protein